MMRVFVYEYCCALGLGREPTDPAHSLYREGRAMRDAVAEDFRRVPGVEVVALDAGDDRSEERAFRSVAAETDLVLLIAPEFGGILATRYLWALDHECVPLGSGYAAIQLTSDKLRLADRWKSSGIPTPHTMKMDDWPSDRVPVIFKPRDGAGSITTQLVELASEIPSARERARSEYDGLMIAQDFIPGCPASVAFLVGPRETLALPPTFQLLSSDGRFRYEGGEVPIPQDLAARAVALSRAAIACVPGLLGYIGVDLILGDAGDYAIEINPRLTTSYVGLRGLADFNLAEAMLRVARGEPVGELAWKPGRVRFWPDGAIRHESGPGAIFS
jgi:predicted ATP-grasp superfamily ATP-dependent carboligase